MKKIITIVIVLLIAAAAVWFGLPYLKQMNAKQEKVIYMTQTIQTGDMRRTISSTGTVEPEELVNVGAQIGGIITVFGKDVDGNGIDYGSRVKAGQILAQIDDSLYTAERDIAMAAAEQAEASIESEKASLEQCQAKFSLAESNWKRNEQLYLQGALSRSDYDSSLYEYTTAKAALALCNAQLREAKAKLMSAKATLSKAVKNLGYCTIYSPVDGVIIDRRVNIGQTVNASMNAPSLFLIARDLKRMEVWVSVNEADIGNIKPGGKAEFTVDTLPGRVFKGVVKKVRLNATMSQNVVTYVVEITTDNPDGALLPYLTANVKFILEEQNGVFMLPNAAFRFNPPDMPPPPPMDGDKRIVWYQNADGSIAPARVVIGMNDGTNTQIIDSFELPADAQVITGSQTIGGKMPPPPPPGMAGGDGGGNNNPFLPKMPKPPHERNRGRR